MSEIYGNGTVVTFSNGFVASAQIERIGGLDRSVATNDVTPLSQADDSYKLTKSSKRKAIEPMSGVAFFDPADDLKGLGEPIDCTVVYPGGTRQLSGKGFMTGNGTGELVSDEVAMGSFEFTWKGGTTAGEAPLISDVP